MVVRRALVAGLGVLASLAGAGLAAGQTTGPDIIVGDLQDVSGNPPITIGGVSYKAFAVGTTSCNKGNVPVNWWTGGTDNRHPAISQNLYRLTPDGRFEQIGQGALKHGFTALQGGTCTSYFGFGCNATAGTTLGVGCSDPYDSGLNNNPGGMGPKWQVNAATGLFPYPYPSNANSGPIRARMTDLNTSPAGSRFFVEGQYIVGDDAAAGNKNNNASWREVNVAASTGSVPTATDFSITMSSGSSGVVHREQSGVDAWKSVDAGVTLMIFDVPSDGRFVLASRVTGTGPYKYEYALYNMNSHRSAGSMVIPLPGTQSALTGVGFHGVESVGEPDAFPDPLNPQLSDWAVSGGGASATSVSWAGPAHNGGMPVYSMDSTQYKVGTFTQGSGNDHSAHVLRWGMMFNFRFTSEVAPVGTGSIAVGLWRPGSGASFVMTGVPTPSGATVGTLAASCCNGTTCTVATQAACGAGTWGLPGTTCAANPCNNGACCLLDLSCAQYNAADCASQAGSYQGDGSACAASPCPTGACCNNTSNTCTTGGTSCPAGSTYMGLHTSCGSPPCPTGACCTPSTGVCTVGGTACSGGATYMGTGSVCGAATCPTGACCNNSTGGCTVGGTGCLAGYTFMGTGSACGSVACIVTEYCMAGSGACNSGPSDERISEFVFGTIDNISGAGNGPSGCYSNFAAVIATLTPGQSYAVTLRNASAYSADQAAVWIDWNHNLSFLDAGEQFTLASVDSGATFTGMVTVPASPLTGTTRLRTRVTWTGDLSPCGSTTYGEVEDYTVAIPVQGVCCRGATCNTSVTQASCVGSGQAGAAYPTSGGNTCNASGNSTTPCCHADYDKINGIQVADIFAYLNDWFAGSKLALPGGDGVHGVLSVNHIFDYLNIWFAGC